MLGQSLSLLLLLAMLSISSSSPLQTVSIPMPDFFDHNATDQHAGSNISTSSLSKRDKVAKMNMCMAVRRGTINVHDSAVMISAFIQYQSKTFSRLINLPGGRETWHVHDSSWHSAHNSWDHCRAHCLIPAVTYGFDAATCHLSAWESMSNAAVGYSSIHSACRSICCYGACSGHVVSDEWTVKQKVHSLRDKKGYEPHYFETDEIFRLQKLTDASDNSNPDKGIGQGLDTWASTNNKYAMPKFNKDIGISCCENIRDVDTCGRWDLFPGDGLHDGAKHSVRVPCKPHT